MASPYSDDLRAKFIAAYEAGNVGLEKLASTFHLGGEGLADKAGDEQCNATRRKTARVCEPVDTGDPRAFVGADR